METIPPAPNILADVPPALGPEEFLALHESGSVRIERIVSHGQASPQDFWYDQKDDEWVMLMRGQAVLQFAEGALLAMKAGSYQIIPRGKKHRVERTSEDAVWLAVHIKTQGA